MCVCVLRAERSLRRADHSSRGVIPSVVFPKCVTEKEKFRKFGKKIFVYVLMPSMSSSVLSFATELCGYPVFVN